MSGTQKIYTPFRLKTMRLKNRIVMAPMHTKFASESGEVTDRLVRYLEERAKGGVGLIVLENTCIDWKYGRAAGNPVTLHDDLNRSGLSNIALAVHRHGTKIVTQLHHTGRQNLRSNIGGGDAPVAPSVVKSFIGGDTPRELSNAEIEDIIQMYVDAARRTKDAGFDGVELHGAHGYILTQFFSPYTNRRHDRWGGSFKNRARFPVEVVRQIRYQVGDDFPILYRLSAEERIPHDGTTLEDTLKLVPLLEAAGVDCFDVSAGIYDSVEWIYTLQGVKPGSLIPLAEAVKGVTDKPVIGISRLGWDMDFAAQVVEEGRVDLAAIGRSLLADPQLPNKAMTGRSDEIRRCIACNECVAFQNMGRQLRCCLNAELGSEYLDPVKDAAIRKKVAVIGAGPSGLECAVTLARRGHSVAVFEKEGIIGGQLVPASSPAYKKEEFFSIIDYYTVMLKKYDIALHCNRTITGPADLGDAEVVILATGAVPVSLPCPGADFVKGAFEVLNGDIPPGVRQVVVIGGSGVGIDIAIKLTETPGVHATIIEMKDEIGGDLNEFLKRHTRAIMADRDIEVLTNTQVVAAEDGAVAARTLFGEKRIPCDLAVAAIGFRPNADAQLSEALRAAGKEVYVLPSSETPGRIFEATQAGFWTALQI